MNKLLRFVICFSFLSHAYAEKNTISEDYKWQQVKAGDEISTFPVTGQVIAEEGALHFQSARVGGRILSLAVEEGSFVKKNATLFHITGPECVSIREEKRIAVKSNLTDLLSTIEQRQKELNIIVTDKGCVMIADSDGILVKRSVNAGSAFNQGDSLAQILESSKLRVEIEVPEKSASIIKTGTVVKFKIPSLNNFKGESTVQQVFPLVDEGTRAMKARLKKISLPAETKLNSMVFAEVALSSGKQCLVVPSTAVTLQDSGSWIIRKTDKVERIPVMIISNQVETLLINPVKDGDLKQNDIIATHDVPFLFQEIKKNERKK